MAKNPFGDEPEPRRINPFGEEESLEPVQDAAQRVQNAARKIRLLRSQIGAEGLSPSGTRELLDQFGSAMDIIAGALREIDRKLK
jgi:hypothetical protein